MPSPPGPVWRDDIERDSWMETWCRVCFQPDEAAKRASGEGQGCPLLLTAATGRLPTQWHRRRDGLLGHTYRCDEFVKNPRSRRRRKASPDETLPMFDVPLQNYVPLVPVPGWPDRPVKRAKKARTDHA